MKTGLIILSSIIGFVVGVVWAMHMADENLTTDLDFEIEQLMGSFHD